MRGWKPLCLGLLLLCTGCYETRSYRLAVRNDLSTPVKVCLTKRFGPTEAGWESPEELAAPPHPASDEQTPGTEVPPGKTATLPASPAGMFTGTFDPERGRAIMRVYAGTPTLSEMNAISTGSLNRLDIPLEIGVNRIELKEAADGSMTAVRIDGPWPSPDAP